MRILMTGLTAGIGLRAAKTLLEDGHTIVAGVRNPSALPAELAGRVEVHALDLASLAAVRQFAGAVASLGPFDAFVFNAGMQASDITKTVDGYERTFAVNHLAHFLLLEMLLERLVKGGRVVVTASGVHDPAEGIPFPPPPHHADAELLAHPENDSQRDSYARFAGGRAYSASKLANVMTVLELGRRRPDLVSIAYDPAYVPGTSLGRASPGFAVKLFEWLAPLFIAESRRSTVERSGDALAALAVDPAYADERGAYYSMRGEAKKIAPAEMARDEGAARRLWEDSVRLVEAAAAARSR